MRDRYLNLWYLYICQIAQICLFDRGWSFKMAQTQTWSPTWLWPNLTILACGQVSGPIIITCGQVSGPMAKGVAAIGSSYIAIGLHTGEVNITLTLIKTKTFQTSTYPLMHFTDAPQIVIWKGWITEYDPILALWHRTGTMYRLTLIEALAPIPFNVRFFCFMLSWKGTLTSAKLLEGERKTSKFLYFQNCLVSGSETMSVQSLTWPVPIRGPERWQGWRSNHSAHSFESST